MSIATTKLINITENYDDFEWLFGAEEAQQLQQAERHQVEVLREASAGYWDIRLSNGKEFDAISWYHLQGFNPYTKIDVSDLTGR